MLARLICRLLGHVLDELNVIEGDPSYIYVSQGKCARCGAPVIEVRDLRDDENSDGLQ
jgi:hypothetical protein